MQDAAKQSWTLWFDKRGTPVGVKGGVMIGSTDDYERTLEVVPAAERDRYREALAKVRRNVRAVFREWEAYPESYPRSALMDDLRDALNDGSPAVSGEAPGSGSILR